MDPIDLTGISGRLRSISADAVTLAGALATLQQVRWHSPAAELYREQLRQRVRQVRDLADAAAGLAREVDALEEEASRTLAIVVARVRETQRDLEALAREAGGAAGSVADEVEERLGIAHCRLLRARGVLDRYRRVRSKGLW